ncbi:MAG: TatD family hydrolase [Bacteroidota bacterium]
MKFIDTHAHLYLKQFKADIDEVMQRAKACLHKIYLPNIDASSIDDMHSIEAKYPDFCYAMMGVHPCSIKENYKEELNIAKKHLSNRKYVAIGEIGSDKYWDTTHLKEQEDAFRIQLNWATALKLPVVIHSRDSLDLNIRIVKEEQDGNLRGIFHCFNGTLEQAQAIQELGFLMGVGGVLTFKNAGMKPIYEQIDLEHLVLETDAPYLTPAPHRGKRNESAYIPLIAEVLSEVKDLSLETIAERTNENANELFRIQAV